MRLLALLLVSVFSSLGQDHLVPAKDREILKRNSYVLTANERFSGCVVAYKNFEAHTVRIDCSAAMPWSSRAKTVKTFCVVEGREKLVSIFVDETTHTIQRCSVKK